MTVKYPKYLGVSVLACGLVLLLLAAFLSDPYMGGLGAVILAVAVLMVAYFVLNTSLRLEDGSLTVYRMEGSTRDAAPLYALAVPAVLDRSFPFSRVSLRLQDEETGEVWTSLFSRVDYQGDGKGTIQLFFEELPASDRPIKASCEYYLYGVIFQRAWVHYEETSRGDVRLSPIA